MRELLFLFIIYAFLGWVVEVIFHVINVGKFINRGFLQGPYCPIYGFGMFFILLLLEPFMDNTLLLFVFAIIITTLIELIGGYLLEKFLKKRWWDYSNLPYNFHGYICVKFSLYWGVGAVITIRVVHPVLEELYKITPEVVQIIFMIVMYTMMLIDFITTINNVFGLNKKLDELEKASVQIRKLSDGIGEKITEGVQMAQTTGENIKDKEEEFSAELTVRKYQYNEEMEERRKKLEAEIEEKKQKYNMELEKLASKHKRLLKAFPDMKSRDHEDLLKRLKEKVNKK